MKRAGDLYIGIINVIIPIRAVFVKTPVSDCALPAGRQRPALVKRNAERLRKKSEMSARSETVRENTEESLQTG